MNYACAVYSSTRSSGQGWKQLLWCSAAVLTLGIGTAQGQMGGIGLEGVVNDQGKVGGIGSVVLPLASHPGGMFYTTLQAGKFKGETVGSLGFGYRALIGEGMAGGYVTGDVQEGLSKNKRLYGFTAGAEIVSANGLGFGVNLYVPIKREQPLKTASDQVILRDKPGSSNCSNPTSTDTRQCDLVVRHQEDGKRVALRGGDVNISYRLPFLGEGIDVVPYIGGHMFEGGVKGWQGGMDLSAPLGGGLLITGGGKVIHNKELGTEKILTVGLRWNFGGEAGNSSYLNRRMNESPRRLQPGMVHQNKAGRVSDEQVMTPGGVTITDVQFVDVNNEGNAHVKVGNMASGGIVIFSGNVIAANGQAIEVKKSNVTIMGGSNVLEVTGVRDGKAYLFTAPGSRPTVTQTNNMTSVFLVNGQNKVLLQGIDIVGGKHGLEIQNSVDSRVVDVHGRDAANNGFTVTGSLRARFEQVTSSNVGRSGLYFSGSANATLTNVTSSNAGAYGLDFIMSNGATLTNVTSSNAGTYGLVFDNSNGATLTNVTSSNAGTYGLVFVLSNGATLTNVTSSNAGTYGLYFSDSNGATLDRVKIDQGNLGSTGIHLFNSGAAGAEIRFKDVVVENAKRGYQFGRLSHVTDLGGNRAVNVTDVCDGMADATGTVNVTQGMMVYPCR